MIKQMTKEEFLIEAQIHYYGSEYGSEGVFNLMDDEIKLMVISKDIDDNACLEDYEIIFLNKTNNEKLLTLYSNSIINSGEELSEKQFYLLTEEYKLKWHDMLKHDYYSNGDDEDWAEGFVAKWYIKYKADWREEQIDNILND